MGKYRKAIAAALGAVVLALQVVATDGGSYADVCGAAIAMLTALSVYVVKNDTE